MTTVTGNTYPVRARLKAMGGRWNKAAQGWDFADDGKAGEAQSLVDAQGPSTYEPRARSVYTRFSSGAEVYRNARGRCEDAPCCGCCS